MQGPYDADVPLQVVCYFKRTADSDTKMAGAPVELDKRLGGLIGALRSRGEFAGDDLETLLSTYQGASSRSVLLLDRRARRRSPSTRWSGSARPHSGRP